MDSANSNDKDIVMDYTKQSKQTIDEMLDNINFSDEEEDKEKKFKLDEETYQREMQKVQRLYEEEDNSGTMNTYTGTKHEQDKMKEIPLPFELTSNSKMLLCGIVNHIVEDKVLIDHCLNNRIVNLDNIIFNRNNMALGFIDDVIGNIDNPIYVMRIYPNLVDSKVGINKGEEMFICEDKATLVKKENLMKGKGCDASNAFDEEVMDNEKEYSDDEEEIQVKALKRQQKKKEKNDCPIKKMKYDQTHQNVFMPQQGQMPLIQPLQPTVFSPYVNSEYKFQLPQCNTNTGLYASNAMMPSMMMNQQAFDNMNNFMNSLLHQGINPFARPSQSIDLNQFPPSSLPK